MAEQRQEVLRSWKEVGKLGGKRGKSTSAWFWCAHYIFKFRLKLCTDLMQALTPGVSFT